MNPSASYASQPPQLLHNLQVGASLPPATHQPQSVSQPPPMPPQPVPKYEDDEYSGQPPPVPLAEQQAQPSAGLAQDDPAAAALLVARLEPHSAVQDGRKYSLDVVQQPMRARMCGFGDKDRRPITPPPCVRLVVTDLATGKEVDCNDIEHTMFVLNVDLWSEDASKEVNLVRHTSATPSISSTQPASFSTLEANQAQSGQFPHILPSNRESQNYPGQHPQSRGYPGYPGSYMQQNGINHPTPYFDSMQGVPQLPSNVSMHYSGRMWEGPMPLAARLALAPATPQGMFTRNLIGSLAASASRLTDPDEKIGIWFVLQDLSVRTEGPFRLRFSFVNVGPPGKSANGNPANQSSIVNTGKAPVLATAFSEVFQVYSAKKFPGVCESTALSKCFVTQGIKIPIRKEGSNKNNDDDDMLDD